MENINIHEMLDKLKAANSAKELVGALKEQGIDITADKAEKMFAKLMSGELSDDDLAAVSGGLRMPTLPFV